ncbi:MAG: hypothetical protein D6831_04105 [Aquificota bacterium]|nr:MAG: hypothetical protein D6831_04105 [Aquificota bacterium]
MEQKDIEELASAIVENILFPDRKKRQKTNKYQSPKLLTFTGDDVLEQLGTAKACSPFPP